MRLHGKAFQIEVGTSVVSDDWDAMGTKQHIFAKPFRDAKSADFTEVPAIGVYTRILECELI